jgi:hypothetical protein
MPLLGEPAKYLMQVNFCAAREGVLSILPIDDTNAKWGREGA